MEERRILCDFCGKPGALPICHDYKYEYDGVEMNYIHMTTDLCPDHMRECFQMLWSGKRQLAGMTVEVLNTVLKNAKYRKENDK